MKASGYRENKGISLLEIMLVIVIISAISLSATRYYLVTREGARVAQAADVIHNIAEASYTWVQAQSGFSGISLSVLTDTKLLPDDYSTNPTKINPWHGSLDLSVNSDNNLQVTLGSISSYNVCQDLAAKVAKSAASAVCTQTSTGTAIVTATFEAP